MIEKVNEFNFDKEVIDAEGPVLAIFYLPGPRNRNRLEMAERLRSSLDGVVKIVKIDVDESPNLARRFDITRVPHTLVLTKGHVSWTERAS
jgi:Thioredoxin domain-containing protein